jgi:hypothetical protein
MNAQLNCMISQAGSELQHAGEVARFASEVQAGRLISPTRIPAAGPNTRRREGRIRRDPPAEPARS